MKHNGKRPLPAKWYETTDCKQNLILFLLLQSNRSWETKEDDCARCNHYWPYNNK